MQTGVHTVGLQVKPPPASAGPTRVCSASEASNLAACLSAQQGSRMWPRVWTPVTCVGDSDGVPAPGFCTVKVHYCCHLENKSVD